MFGNVKITEIVINNLAWIMIFIVFLLVLAIVVVKLIRRFLRKEVKGMAKDLAQGLGELPFDVVGGAYRGIKSGTEKLSKEVGSDALFVAKKAGTGIGRSSKRLGKVAKIVARQTAKGIGCAGKEMIIVSKGISSVGKKISSKLTRANRKNRQRSM